MSFGHITSHLACYTHFMVQVALGLCCLCMFSSACLIESTFFHKCDRSQDSKYHFTIKSTEIFCLTFYVNHEISSESCPDEYHEVTYLMFSYQDFIPSKIN